MATEFLFFCTFFEVVSIFVQVDFDDRAVPVHNQCKAVSDRAGLRHAPRLGYMQSGHGRGLEKTRRQGDGETTCASVRRTDALWPPATAGMRPIVPAG